jgi:hypothetical protein
MKLTLRFLPALVLAFAACTEIVPEAADSPLAPEAQMSEAVAPALGVSTTCHSFRKELDSVNEQLSANTAAPELQQKQAALSVIVADVCN